MTDLEIQELLRRTWRDLSLLQTAMERGGIDISLCMKCGAPTACIPDGLCICGQCAGSELHP